MKADSSYFNLENSCYTFVDSKTLKSYSAPDGTQDYASERVYKLMGNVWRETEYNVDNAKPQNVICYDVDQARDLDSPYEFMLPVYHTMAILSALLIFYAAYKLILYPFFRTK